MTWGKSRSRDPNVMFVVSYEDGRTAYLTVDRDSLRSGNHMARVIVDECQKRGPIPEGKITGVKRVR